MANLSFIDNLQIHPIHLFNERLTWTDKDRGKLMRAKITASFASTDFIFFNLRRRNYCSHHSSYHRYTLQAETTQHCCKWTFWSYCVTRIEADWFCVQLLLSHWQKNPTLYCHNRTFVCQQSSGFQNYWDAWDRLSDNNMGNNISPSKWLTYILIVLLWIQAREGKNVRGSQETMGERLESEIKREWGELETEEWMEEELVMSRKVWCKKQDESLISFFSSNFNLSLWP